MSDRSPNVQRGSQNCRGAFAIIWRLEEITMTLKALTRSALILAAAVALTTHGHEPDPVVILE